MAVEIDRLDLDITIKQEKDSSNRVRDLANAISRLNTVINKIDNSKMSSTFSTITKGVGLLTSKIRQANKELTSLVRNNVQNSDIQLKNIGTIEVENPNKNKSQSGEVGKVQGKATQLDITDTTNKTNSTAKNFSEITNKTQLWEEQLKLVEKNLKNANLTQEQYLSLQSKKITLTERIAKEEEKSTKSNKRSLVDIFKRVLLYRIARSIIQEIVSSLKETFDIMAKESNSFNKTLSTTQSRIQVIKSSVGLIAGSILPLVNILLIPITVLVSSIANGVARLSALLQGQSKYLKINSKYFKDYKNQIQGALLSFDTFTTLNGNQMGDLFSEEEVGDKTNALLEGLNSVVAILDYISSIALIKHLIQGGLTKNADEIKTIANNTQEASDNTQNLANNVDKTDENIKKTKISAEKLKEVLVGTAQILSGITTAVLSTISAVENFKTDNIRKGIADILKAVGGVLLAVGGLLTILDAKKGALALTISGMLFTTASILVSAFADGGMFEGAGTMYALAGESGAEIVAKGSQGTGVTNIAQFRQAMVEALYEYGASRGNLDNIKIQMNNTQVGKMVARSSYDEMKRQGLL